ncbi:MAG: hypothetical protein AAF687_05990 [Pseudomonadota bacterium]
MTLSLLSAAAAAIESCGFDCSDEKQQLADLLGSTFDGIILLPFAMLFVWGIHRSKLNRWFFVTAAFATVFALVFSSIVALFVAPIFLFSDLMLEMVGLDRFVYQPMPAILVCFGGALVLAWWLMHRDHIEAFE